MEDLVATAAKAAHEVNRLYCEALLDYSQPTWDMAPDWQKDSAYAGAKAIEDNPDTTPEQSHEGWMKQKEDDGWTYGEVKDPEQKKHPCMVPYSSLPAAQRYKDTIFGAVVRGVLSRAA